MAEFVYRLWLVRFLSRSYFEFDWNRGNSDKNFLKHGTTQKDAEDAFYNDFIVPLGEQVNPRVINEHRYAIIGQSFSKKVLFICFTIRAGRVRVISLRAASRKERNFYEQQKKICENE